MFDNIQCVPLNFLFVGVEPSFTAYFFTKDAALDASIDSCRTVQDARKKVMTALYDVYVIEGEEFDALELMEEMRKKAKNSIIAAIGRPSSPKLQFLLDQHLIDFKLDKPLAPQQINDFCIALQKHFHRKVSPQADIPKTVLPLVYIVDPDRTFLDLLEKVNRSFPFDLQVESDPKRALEQIDSQEFRPDVLVLAYAFPGYRVSPFDLLEKELLKERKTPLISALILDKEDIKSRVYASEKKIQYVFHKPLYAHTLLKSIQEMLEAGQRQNFKVLILDDDEDFCRFVVDILNESGVEAQAIHHASELFSTLDTLNPQLLLLDLVLPDYDGMDLLKTLRHDAAHSDLNILIITGKEEPATRLLAYSAKADDIIYKPIDPILFQKRIMSFSERQNHVVEETGMGSMKELTTEIHRCLLTEEPNPAFIAVFEIDKLNDWVKTHSQEAFKDLLVSINQQIHLALEKDQICYHFDGTKYALLFEKTDASTVSKTVSNLLNQLIKRESLSSIRFNCAIAPISNEYGNAEKNLKFVDYALGEITDKEGKGAVNLSQMVPKESGSMQKEVVLIDEDEQLLRILKTHFELHGLAVTTFNTGKSALEALLDRTANNLPSLIISERKLEDMDGIDILVKLKMQFKRNIPFYILTFFASDKDILEGVKQGALEYITKPFNTTILMEKSLNTIFHKPLL